MVTRKTCWLLLSLFGVIVLFSSCAGDISATSPLPATLSPPDATQLSETQDSSSSAPGASASSIVPTTSAPTATLSATPTPASLPTSKPEPTKITQSFEIPPADFIVDYTRTDLNRSVRFSSVEYNGKLIDTHTHVVALENESVDIEILERVITSMDSAHVDSITVMPVPNQQVLKNRILIDEQYKILLELGGGSIKLFRESGFISKWLNDAYQDGYDNSELTRLLNGLSNDINNPDSAGIGEIGLYHFNKTGNQPVIAYSPNFIPFLEVIRLITEGGMWLDLHAEPVDPDGKSYEDQVFGGLALLYRLFPDLKLIYSHTAMTNPTNARRILETYPNIMMNIKIVTNHDDWRNLEPVTDRQGYLYDDWAELFEEMPERFTIGTDMKFGLNEKDDVIEYGEEIRLVRRLLGSIDTDAAEMIAYKNAERVFK